MTGRAGSLPEHMRDAVARYGDTRTVVLVDGEHYPQVIVDVLHALSAEGWTILCVALVGGSEKLRTEPDYGWPHVRGEGAPAHTVRRTCEELRPDWVIDLSDEPLLVFEERARVIGAVAALGISYAGADTVVRAPALLPVTVPSLAVIGTGKRIGKTAISAHVARVADRALGGQGDVVVVAMGRGGPAEPVVVDRAGGAITVERLLDISRGGAHAASDYLEDAALTGLTTIGCRRAGGGLLGAPVCSNVLEGVSVLEQLAPRLAIFEGSGSCIPPVRADATVLVGSVLRPRDLFDDFGAYRLEHADIVLVAGNDAQVAREMCTRIEDAHPGLRAIGVALRPTPAEPVEGRRIAAFTTAPESVSDVILGELARAGADVALLSHALARRDQLRADIATAVERGVEAFVVEVKAAAIDVVAEAAAAHGVDVVFLDNPPRPHDEALDLDGLLAGMALRVADREQVQL